MQIKHYIDGKEVSEEQVNILISEALTDDQCRTIVEETTKGKTIGFTEDYFRVYAMYLVASDIRVTGQYDRGDIKIDKETLGFDYTVEYIKEDE